MELCASIQAQCWLTVLCFETRPNAKPENVGWLSKKKNDILGLAFAHAGLGNNSGNETTIELSWKKQVNSTVFIQPDIQYIINPGGNCSNLNNSMAAIVRLGISL